MNTTQEQITKQNNYLRSLLWNPLRDLAVARNSSIEDEDGKRKFVKVPGCHRCMYCKKWNLVKDMIKHKNNWYCKEHQPKVDLRRFNGASYKVANF